MVQTPTLVPSSTAGNLTVGVSWYYYSSLDRKELAHSLQRLHRPEKMILMRYFFSGLVEWALDVVIPRGG